MAAMQNNESTDQLEALVALGVEIIFTVRHIARRVSAVRAQLKPIEVQA
jgi:hypothetical protein